MKLQKVTVVVTFLAFGYYFFFTHQTHEMIGFGLLTIINILLYLKKEVTINVYARGKDDGAI